MANGVIDLGSRRATDRARAGGKAAALSTLIREGFDVPDGFVIETQVFDDLTRTLDIHGPSLLDRLEPDKLEELRRAILGAELPATSKRNIISSFRRLGGSVAVRSSMTGEDGLHKSLAGQLATVLDVDDETQLVDAVKECYASVFSNRLHEYLHAFDQDSDAPLPVSLGMAVVVQRMSPSIVGGVAFSADPETGERCVIIEAAAGRRGAVESGTVEPIRWVIDARDEIIESYAGQTDSPVIDDDHLLELAGIVRKVAASFGCPQDIEWVYDGRRFQLLQTRPITTLVGKHIYSNRLVADMSPGLVKPLLWSTNTVSMARNVFGRIFTELIGPNDIDFSLLSRRFHSRIYTDMTMLGELLETIGLPANMFEMMARDEKGERPPFRFSMIRLLRHGRLLRFLWRQAGSKKSIAAFVKKQNLDLEPHRRVEPSSLTPTELAQRADDLMELHGRSQWHVFGAALNMMIRKRLLDRFLKRHAPDVSAQELLHGLSGLKGLEPNEELREMAACAGRLNPGDVDAMSRGLDEDIRERLSRHSEGQELIRKFDGFLNRYGYLSANGTDFSEESWIERPDLVWRSIVRHIETDDEPRGPETEDPVKRVTDHIDSIQRLQFDKLFSSTVDYMRLREQTSLLLSEDAYQMRRVFLAIGNALVETGALDDANDVFYLYIDELRNLVDGPEHEGDLQRIVRERRDEMERDAAIDPPHTISGDTPPRLPIQANRLEFLAGIGGSAGIVEGRVVVVREPADAPDNLTKNDILVVPFTDISWTPLFPSIGGIIAEAGGQLSHTAIIAREYNLPAVVSVRRATHVLKDGQVVTLDGRTGRVYIEDDSERKGAPK